MKNNFQIKLCSDLDYEEMVADIAWNQKSFATINRDKGIDNMEIKFDINPEELATLNLPLDEFIDALKEVREVLRNN